MSHKHPTHHIDEAKGDQKIMAQHAREAIENIENGHTVLHDAIQHTLSDGKVARVFITSE